MNKIFTKLFFTYLIVLIVCLVVLGPVSGISLKKYYTDRLSHELWLSGILTKYILNEDLINGDRPDIQNKCVQIGKEINSRVTITDKEGTVLGDTEEDPKLMENHKDRPEIKNALSGKIGQAVHYSNTLKKDMMYTAVPVIDGSSVIGVVRFAIPNAGVKSGVSHIYSVLLFSSLVGIFAALLLSAFIGNSLARPIAHMQNIANKITAGDISQRIKIQSKDELGKLAEHLNAMAQELERKINEITKDKKELGAILSSMIEGVMVISSDERIILVNPPILKMLDIRTKAPIGKPYWEVIRNEGINAILRESIKDRISIGREVRIISVEEIYFSVQTSVVLNEFGGFLGIAAVFHNISEFKKIDKMRSEFTANVTHELKTPLTSIKGFVETLLDGAVNDKEKAAEYLNIVKRHTDRLEALINDLLDLSKIESKGVKMDFGSVNIPEIARKTVALYEDKVRAKQQALVMDVKSDIPRVLGSESKLEQVFSNLLDNAIKFTPDGGKISVVVSDDKEHVNIDFKDSGIGIPQEHLSRIFERFYRVDKTRARELGGTGLGLSIVKHIVEMHGGKVSVESVSEKGSVFSVVLPVNHATIS